MHNHLSISAQKYLCKYKDTYFILQSKCLHIDKDSFGSKIPKDNSAHSVVKINQKYGIWNW